MRLPTSLALAVVPAAAAVACPVCDTANGNAVRSGILTDFGAHFAATVAPFPILLLLVAVLHWGWPRRSP